MKECFLFPCRGRYWAAQGAAVRMRLDTGLRVWVHSSALVIAYSASMRRKARFVVNYIASLTTTPHASQS